MYLVRVRVRARARARARVRVRVRVRVRRVLVPRVLCDRKARAVGQKRLAVAEAGVGSVVDGVGRAHVEELTPLGRLAERLGWGQG